MQAGEPDRTPAPAASGTLVARLRALWRAPGWPDRELAAAIALFLALGPLLTIAGAHLLVARERAEIRHLQATLAPRLAAEQAARDARPVIAAAVQRPIIGAMLDALARGLPADATIVRAERTGEAFEIDVATADPDRLRTAIRRDPALARFRDRNQRQSDTAMIVTLRDETR